MKILHKTFFFYLCNIGKSIMVVLQKEKKNNLLVYLVNKNMTDEQAINLKNTYVKPSQIDLTIDENADVYEATEQEDGEIQKGQLLLRFRKDALPKKHTELFYDNIIKFAMRPTTNRGATSGSNKFTLKDNPKIMTNIIGYFDKIAPKQKWILGKLGKTLKTNVRETYFVTNYPEEYKKTLPLIQDIDHLYAKNIPEQYKLQRKKANQTPFHIDKTAFTTVTTNVNFQTSIHKDRGDDEEGFGNLSVIEHGKYDGGETCFPQYGIGVNVRTGDILFMNVHEWHGNLPIKPKTKDAKRLSIVAYLRTNIWKKTKGKSRKFMKQHNNMLRKTFKKKIV